MKKSKLHLVVFVWYVPPSLRTTVTKQMLQGICTKCDSKFQSVSKKYHSCELQLYKISEYDKKETTTGLLDFLQFSLSSLRVGHNYHIFNLHTFYNLPFKIICILQLLFQCLPEWRLHTEIWFNKSKRKDMSSSLSIHRIVCCMLNCDCCGLTGFFLIF